MNDIRKVLFFIFQWLIHIISFALLIVVFKVCSAFVIVYLDKFDSGTSLLPRLIVYVIGGSYLLFLRRKKIKF